MKLRKLEIEDASFMLEWMHDKFVVSDMQANFAEKTIADCEAFIRASWSDTSNLHLAITDDGDTYMGTVSLKHITDSSAEFAITIRKSAMGQGLSKLAMAEMLRIGLEDMNLEQIYWCVSPKNKRALRFYDKNSYHRVGFDKLGNLEGYVHPEYYIWYQQSR